MADKNVSFSDEQLRLLVDSMAGQLGDSRERNTQIMNMLIRETVLFRDKLKEETGEILTVGDTRVALEALDQHLSSGRLPRDLTPEQKALAQIWIDRMTLFGSG